MDNEMFVPPLPNCFKDLTLAEESLISAVQCCITLIHLRHGQLAMSGNSIFFYQNLQQVADSLPRSQCEIVTFGKIREDGRVSYLRVRRAKVLQCLSYLIKNNELYKDIKLNMDVLNNLPIDGHIKPLDHISTTTTGADYDSVIPTVRFST